MDCNVNDCPKKKYPQVLGCIGWENVKWILGIIGAFVAVIFGTMATLSAKADRVIAVEEKVDYIYKYLLEKKEK